MEALGGFAEGIAHDLNNTLFPIVINAETLPEDTDPGSSSHQILQEVIQAAYRQRDLIQQILTFNRRRERTNCPVKMKPLTLAFLRSSLPSTIEIHTQIDAVSDTILGDATQIQQAITNLCRNAADAPESKTGIIEIHLSAKHLKDRAPQTELTAGEYLELTVKDTGACIDPEVLDHIFEPFFTTKEVGKGTGMGLATVHGIIKDHGGTNTAESEPGKGTRFSVYLPATQILSRMQQEQTGEK